MITVVFILDLGSIVGMMIGTLVCDRPQHGRHRRGSR